MYAAQYLAGGEVPGKQGSGQVGIVPYRAYRTVDGDLVVAAGNNDLFGRLARLLGRPEWSTDDRFADNPARVRNAVALYAMLEEHFAHRTNADWIAALDEAGIPCAPVQDVAGMLNNPQTQALGLLQTVPGSSIPLVGLPLRLDGERPQPRSASPKLGEMNP